MNALDLYVKLVGRFSAAENRARWPVPAESELVTVRFKKRPDPDAQGDYRRTKSRAFVIIYRDTAPVGGTPSQQAALAEDPLGELITFSHEMGHNYSSLLETFIDAKKATPVESYREELRAWEHGRGLLDAHGFNRWKEFEGQRNDFLKTYRGGHGIDHSVALEIERQVTEEVRAQPSKRYTESWNPARGPE